MFKKGDIIRLKTESGGWVHCEIDHNTITKVLDIIKTKQSINCVDCEEYCSGCCYVLNVGDPDKDFSYFYGSDINNSFELDIKKMRNRKLERILF